MSRGLKLNVKNVLLGYHNFSDTLGRNDYRFLSGFTSLAGPRSTPFSRPDYECYKQDIIKTSPVNLSETVFPRKIDDIVLKRVFSEIPVTGKWLEESRSLPIVTPGAKRLPQDTAHSFCYDQKDPQYPPPTPKSRSDCKKDPLKQIPPYKKITPKNHPIHNCRLYSTKASLPRNLKAKSCLPRHLVSPKWVAITARSLCDESGPKNDERVAPKCPLAAPRCPPPAPRCTPEPPRCPPPLPRCTAPSPSCNPPPPKPRPQKCGETVICPVCCNPKKKKK